MQLSTNQQRVALVTGAAVGIGRAEAVALARTGADVAVLGHVDLAGAEETARQCRALGRRAIVVKADVRRSTEIRSAIEEIARALGHLDILVNNAGVLGGGPNTRLVDLDEETWHLMLDTHLTGTFLCIKHSAPLMMARRWGRIINTASIHGRVGGRPSLGHYGAAKAGIIALTRTAARELAEYGITCNAVSPGIVQTERVASYLSPERLAALSQQVPVGRLAEPEDVANAVVFLASDAAAYVNGTVLDVHGGRAEFVF